MNRASCSRAEVAGEMSLLLCLLHDLKHYYLGREYWLIPKTMTNNITVNIFIIIEDN